MRAVVTRLVTDLPHAQLGSEILGRAIRHGLGADVAELVVTDRRQEAFVQLVQLPTWRRGAQ